VDANRSTKVVFEDVRTLVEELINSSNKPAEPK